MGRAHRHGAADSTITLALGHKLGPQWGRQAMISGTGLEPVIFHHLSQAV
jgi:hypothetical protein